MFRFGEPTYLYLLLLLPFLAAFYLYSNYKRRKNIRRFGDPTLLAQLMPDVSKYRPDIKFWIIFVVIGLFSVLLARPQFGSKPETVKRDWYVVDATGKTLGRLATELARRLRGKHKAEYTPHVDTGDYVIVINADKVAVTGKKLDQKIYYSHSDYVGGMKEATLREMMAKKPEKVVELAVKGMLPKGPLGRQMFTKLHVYAGAEHAHAAQKPEVLTF